MAEQKVDGQAIIDSTLGILRDQRDEEQLQDQHGFLVVNVQLFKPSNVSAGTTVDQRHLIVGEVVFEQTFAAAPSVTFGQVAEFNSDPTVSPSMVKANSYMPFLGVPYVYSWKLGKGVVEGFSVGMYALTTPPENVRQHRIDWRAIGHASAYQDQNTDESWTEAYDSNEADYLVDDQSDTDFDGSAEDPTFEEELEE